MNYSEYIAKLSKKSFRVKKGDLHDLTEQEDFDLCDFVIAAFETNVSLLSTELMFETYDQWMKISLNDIKHIAQSLTNDIAMTDFLVFCGKYLGIDVREFFSNTPKEVTKSVTDYVGRESAKFYYVRKYDDSRLAGFGLTFPNSFEKIKSRLLDEGATESKPIPPEKLELPDFPPD